MARDGLPWLKIGCLSLIGFPLLGILVLVFFVRVSSPGEAVEETLVREIPAMPGAATGLVPGSSDIASDLSIPGGVPGRVKLDFSGAEVFLTAGPAGSPITIQTAYNAHAGEVRERFEPGSGDGWTYKVEFHAATDSFLDLVSGFVGGPLPQMIVSLPSETPLALELSLAQGGGVVDLGGLWLSTVEVTLSQGGLDLDVTKPLTEPLQRFESTGSMGGMQLRSLGNASPRVLQITQRMGGLDLDLQGQWRQDSEIEISVDMGGVAVRVPDDVSVRGLAERAIEPSRDSDEDRPTLNIQTRVNMGEIEVIR